jgi:hypothetical protein
MEYGEDMGMDLQGQYSQQKGLLQQEDDNEICEVCHKRNDPNIVMTNINEPQVTPWIGCEYADCSKWYHPSCIGISNHEYEAIGDKEWFCSKQCEINHHNSAANK